jgi:hypothetical protein
MLNFTHPHGLPTMIFGFYGVPTYVESYEFCTYFLYMKLNQFFPIKNKIYMISWIIICLHFLSYIRHI